MSQDHDAEQLRKLQLILIQAIGLFNVALGIGLALFMPAFIGRDPTTDIAIWISGGVLALSGVGIWWWGRFHLGGGLDRRSGPVVRRQR